MCSGLSFQVKTEKSPCGLTHPAPKAIHNKQNKVRDKLIRHVSAFAVCSDFLRNKRKYTPDTNAKTIPSMKAKTTHFIHISFSLIFITLLGFVAFILLCRLGFWQWERGKQKEALLIAQAHAATQPALDSAALLAKKGVRFERVAFKGSFLNDFNFLLDNQVHSRQAGYHLLTPVLLNDETVILVNRGWIPLGRSRSILPAIEPIQGTIPIEGYLDFAYRNRFLSSRLESTHTLQWPFRIQEVDTQELSRLINKNIHPMLIVSHKTDPAILSPARHYAYAFQWFALAGILFLLYLITFFKRRKIYAY